MPVNRAVSRTSTPKVAAKGRIVCTITESRPGAVESVGGFLVDDLVIERAFASGGVDKQPASEVESLGRALLPMTGQLMRREQGTDARGVGALLRRVKHDSCWLKSEGFVGLLVNVRSLTRAHASKQPNLVACEMDADNHIPCPKN